MKGIKDLGTVEIAFLIVVFSLVFAWVDKLKDRVANTICDLGHGIVFVLILVFTPLLVRSIMLYNSLRRRRNARAASGR